MLRAPAEAQVVMAVPATAVAAVLIVKVLKDVAVQLEFDAVNVKVTPPAVISAALEV